MFKVLDEVGKSEGEIVDFYVDNELVVHYGVKINGIVYRLSEDALAVDE